MTVSFDAIPASDRMIGVEHAYGPAPSYKYIPALDGIRGVSILTVIISHYGLGNLVPGGFGVNIFFFISGLLISRQLSVELQQSGRLAFGKFYLRRAARLFPALIVMIPIGAAAYMLMGMPIKTAEIFSALLYLTNIYSVFVGYFQPDPAVPHPFIILWSLAVEEHFYLVFPILIASLFSRPKLYVSFLIFTLIAVLSWRFYLYHSCAAMDPLHPVCGLNTSERIYGGTDTRADALLYGVLLTEVLRRDYSGRMLRVLTSIPMFLTGLVLVLASLLIRGDEFRDVYRYTLQSVGLMSVVASIIFSPKFSLVRRFLELPPMIIIGRWSYSLYLYHWVAMIVAGGTSKPEFSMAWYCVAVPLCLGLSVASYYAIEMPVVSLRRRLGSHVVTS